MTRWMLQILGFIGCLVAGVVISRLLLLIVPAVFLVDIACICICCFLFGYWLARHKSSRTVKTRIVNETKPKDYKIEDE